MLGIFESFDLVTQEMAFGDDDMLLLYTDGVTEAMNKEEELFGDERLMGLMSMQAKGSISPKELITAVSAAIGQFAGDTEQADDIAMLAIRKTEA